MKNAILIHGCADKEEFFSDAYPSGSNSHWFPWLQKQLIKQGVQTQTPEMPTPYNPRYEEWKAVFDQYHVTQQTILVGHSCGAGFLLRWLGEERASVGALFLVAPWLDPVKKRKGFLDFPLDTSIQNRVPQIHLLIATDEYVSGVRESVDIISGALPTIHIHQFDHMGHFTFTDMQRAEFPELLQLISV